MIGKTILHYKILEKLGEAQLHFSFVGHSGLSLRSPLNKTEVQNDR